MGIRRFATMTTPWKSGTRHADGRLPGQEVRLVDPETGRDGGQGEIWLRGRNTPGYYNDPERDSEIFTADGWMKTGDLAAWDDGGRLLFRGRLKEMLKSGGINIAPREIETFLQNRPGVAEAYVVGLPDAVKGEVPMAVVIAEPGASPDVESLKAGLLGGARRLQDAAAHRDRRARSPAGHGDWQGPQARTRRAAGPAAVTAPVCMKAVN